MNKPKGKNKYKIEGDMVTVYMNNSPTEMTCDVDDWERLNKHTWHEHNGYIESKINGKEVKFHKCILNTPPGFEIDHINKNPSDNRKENLRIVTHTGNMANLSVYKTNKTGCKGVYPYRRGYCAQININKKRIFLGAYKTLEEAIRARKEAEMKYQHPLLEKETLH